MVVYHSFYKYVREDDDYYSALAGELNIDRVKAKTLLWTFVRRGSDFKLGSVFYNGLNADIDDINQLHYAQKGRDIKHIIQHYVNEKNAH